MPELYSKDHLDINTLKHLSHRLGIPLYQLKKNALNAENSYKFEKELKKSGKGYREISKPGYHLKTIQKTIHKLLLELKVSECAHCGIKKRSNLTNASNHCNKKWVYSLDFENFFPNISHHRVYGLFFKELKCAPKVSSLLTRLCTVRGQVPQGAPTSTDLANLVCRNMDRRIIALASKYQLEYTRHNDDLNFSGGKITERFKRIVKDLVKASGFILNENKECCAANHEAQSVVGLRVNRKKPQVDRETKREWRKRKYRFEKFGSELFPEGKTYEKEMSTIKGQQSYINYVNRS